MLSSANVDVIVKMYMGTSKVNPNIPRFARDLKSISSRGVPVVLIGTLHRHHGHIPPAETTPR